MVQHQKKMDKASGIRNLLGFVATTGDSDVVIHFRDYCNGGALCDAPIGLAIGHFASENNTCEAEFYTHFHLPRSVT